MFMKRTAARARVTTCRKENSLGEGTTSNAFDVDVVLRWYRTSSNIYKEERISKFDCNDGFKNFKIYNICPPNTFIKFDKRKKN